MPYVKNNSHRVRPFSSQTPKIVPVDSILSSVTVLTGPTVSRRTKEVFAVQMLRLICCRPYLWDAGDFYTYSSVSELAEESEECKDHMFRCRTIGILHSTHGRLFITDLDSPTLKDEQPKVRISTVYLLSPPQSTVIPYPVQVFGTLQWKNRPVIFATILQVLSPPIAIRLRNTMSAVASIHLASHSKMLAQDGDPT